MFWQCAIHGNDDAFPSLHNAMLDNGSHLDLIRDDIVKSLKLHRIPLTKPEKIELALKPNDPKVEIAFIEEVILELYDPTNGWKAKTVHALVAPNLNSPLILGLLFLTRNKIIIDHAARSAVKRNTCIDLLNPQPITSPNKDSFLITPLLSQLFH
jgi:hypothetical protein